MKTDAFSGLTVRFNCWFGQISRCVVVLTIIAIFTAPAFATIQSFQGVDPGVTAGQSRPNSDASAVNFIAAASALGTVDTIDFEDLSLGNFTSMTLGSGVTATQMGNDAAIGGIANSNSAFSGYNMTPGGGKFLKFAPQFEIGTATLTFDYDTSILAWGAYLTGLATANGDLFIEFDDGSSQSLSVTGDSSGGILFFGFTSTSAINSLALSLHDVYDTRDVYGIDNVMFTSAPEPATISILALGALAVLRKRRP